MTPEYKEAFIKAYLSDHSEDEIDVRGFVEAYDADCNHTTLYKDYDFYSSIMDAMNLFDRGIEFGQKFDTHIV